jgi:hypothetical protein
LEISRGGLQPKIQPYIIEISCIRYGVRQDSRFDASLIRAQNTGFIEISLAKTLPVTLAMRIIKSVIFGAARK